VLESKKLAEARATYGIDAKAGSDSPMSLDEMLTLLVDLETEMKRAAKGLDFERAAVLRDEIARIKKLLPASMPKSAKGRR